MLNPNTGKSTQPNELTDRWKAVAEFESNIWKDVKHEGNPEGKYSQEEAEELVNQALEENEQYDDRLEATEDRKEINENAVETWTEESLDSRSLENQYPRQENESNEEYAYRMAKIDKTTKLMSALEQRRGQLDQRVAAGEMKQEDAAAILAKLQAEIPQKAEEAARERVDEMATAQTRAKWEEGQQKAFDNLSDEEKAELAAKHPEFADDKEAIALKKIAEIQAKQAELQSQVEELMAELKGDRLSEPEPEPDSESDPDDSGDIDKLKLTPDVISPEAKAAGAKIEKVDPINDTGCKSGITGWLGKKMGSKRFKRIIAAAMITMMTFAAGMTARNNASQKPEKSRGNSKQYEVNLDHEKEKAIERNIDITIDGKTSNKEMRLDKYKESRDPFNDIDKISKVDFGSPSGEGAEGVVDIHQNTVDSQQVLAHWMGIIGDNEELSKAENLKDPVKFKKAQEAYFKFVKDDVDHYKTKIVKGGEHYMSERQEQDKKIKVSPDVVHDTDSHVMGFYNKDGQNILNQGKMKQRIMQKFGIEKSEWGNYDVLGRRAECGGQLVLQYKGSGGTYKIVNGAGSEAVGGQVKPGNNTPSKPNRPDKPKPQEELESKGKKINMDNKNQKPMGPTKEEPGAVRPDKDNRVKPDTKPGSETNTAGDKSEQSNNNYESNAQVIN